MTFLKGAAILAYIAFTGTGAVAQQGSPVGQWGCQFSYTELDQGGNRTSGYGREFIIALNPDGNYYTEGTEMGIGSTFQFRSQGQWQSQGNSVSAQGSEESNNPMGIPGMQFFFSATLEANDMLMLTYEQPDPSQSYVMNRSITQCQRQG